MSATTELELKNALMQVPGATDSVSNRIVQAVVAEAALGGGSGGGGGSGYLGSVASEAAMTALSTAIAGSTCLRSDVGTGGTYYELFQVPYSSAANWQPLGGTLNSTSTRTINLLAEKLPQPLALSVVAGDVLTVTVGATTLPVFVQGDTVVMVGDPPGAAAPTTVTVTSALGTASTYALGGGPAYSIYMGDVPTEAILRASYPSNSAALLALPAGTRTYIESIGVEARRWKNGKYWFREGASNAPLPYEISGTDRWYGPANGATLGGGSQISRLTMRGALYRMPFGRPGTIDAFSIAKNGDTALVGAGSDAWSIYIYECDLAGRPLVQAPIHVVNCNATGSGGAVVKSLLGLGAGVGRVDVDFPAAVDVPAEFAIIICSDYGTAPTLGTLSSNSVFLDAMPSAIVGAYPNPVASPDRSAGFSWTIGSYVPASPPAWSASADYVNGGTSVWAGLIRVVL